MIKPLDTIPENFHAFQMEIADGLRQFYGPRAAADYRRKADVNLRANLHDPSVLALAAYEGHTVMGFLLGIQRGTALEISFLHVLRPYTGGAVEAQLVRKAVGLFRDAGIEAIIVESVSFCALDLEGVFAELGFAHIRRQLMMASTVQPPPPTSEARREIRPIVQDDWPEVAACIVDAYRDHPDALLHTEVQNVINAAEFVARVVEGNFGSFSPSFARAHWGKDSCLGAIFGCEIAEGVGFILQVAVRRKMQNKGIGAALIVSLQHAFEKEKFGKVALGVTQESPACRLYERHHFTRLAPVDAFVWWRPQVTDSTSDDSPRV